MKKIPGTVPARLVAWSVALLLLGGGARLLDAQQSGGSFLPSFNYLITGLWNFTPANAQTAYDVPFKTNGVEATGVVSKIVDLSNAQVLALGATPVTLVAAPGLAKYVDVISINLIFDYTAAYSSVGDVRCYWGARTSGNACSAVVTGSGFFDASADKAIRVAGVPDNTNPPVTNVAVVLQKVSAAEMAGGNAANIVRVVINYRIVATNLSS